MLKVILLTDIKGVGKKGDLVSVKDGYAINYLIPKGLARRATQKDADRIEEEKRFIQKQLKDLSRFVENIDKYIQETIGRRLDIERKAASSGTLYDALDDKEVIRLIKDKARLLDYVDLKVNIPDERITKTGQWVIELEVSYQNMTKKLPLIVNVSSGSKTRLKSDSLVVKK